MKILVGYKGVNLGKDLLRIALEHAKAFKGEVLIVTSFMLQVLSQHYKKSSPCRQISSSESVRSSGFSVAEVAAPSRRGR